MNTVLVIIAYAVSYSAARATGFDLAASLGLAGACSTAVYWLRRPSERRNRELREASEYYANLSRYLRGD